MLQAIEIYFNYNNSIIYQLFLFFSFRIDPFQGTQVWIYHVNTLREMQIIETNGFGEEQRRYE